ncbi:MAG TPA: sigma 54-interacting transcriptional regulator [Terriglobia bacterium]|nr:sigma 54-interacting transcriptional regulator [Terriglobia bacterium]
MAAGKEEDTGRVFQPLQFQAALIELSREESADLGDRLSRFCTVAASSLDVARVSIWLFNDTHTQLRCVHLLDRARNVRESGAILEVDRYPRYFETLEECRTIAAADAATDPSTAEFASGYLDALGIVSMLDVPIRREGRTVGVLCNEHIGPQRQWEAEEQNFAASLADLTALALEADRRRQYNQRLKLLRETDRAILSVRSVHEIAEAALARFHELVPCERASVALFEQGGAIARLVGVFASDNTRLGLGAEVPLDLFGSMTDLRQGKPYMVESVAQVAAEFVRGALEAEGIRSFVSVPLLANDELIGVLNLGSREPAPFPAEYIEIAEEVADSLAVAIRDAHLNQMAERHAAELEQRVTKRTAELSEVNARLRESEERVRSLYDNTPIMMHSIDEHGCVLDVNEFWLKTLGYERSEVIGRPVVNFAAPEYTRLVQEDFMPRLVREGFIKDVEVQGLKKNGERLDFQVSSVVKRDAEGRFLYSQAFLLDITERKKAESARKETEERLASIFRSAMDAIIVIDSERRIVIFNLAAQAVFRCAASDVSGQKLDVFLSESLKQVLSTYMAAADSKAPQLWIPEGPPAVRKDGERFPIEATVSRTDVSTGRLFTIILRDINERKQAEAKLNQLHEENVYLQKELQSELNFEEIVGASPVMQKVFSMIEMVAQTDSTVLLLGDTGTGKELIARAVHNRSRRKQSVMVKVNCGALPANLVETELFGHEKGAFTGAAAQKKGRFELAHRGTIFLDEVGELPIETQTKLLRVLQEQEFERVGGSHTQKVDVRVIAATNRGLGEAVRLGAFRADLYYRLNVFPIEVPPLRNRKEDIPLLTGHFLRRFSQRMGKRIHRISPAVYDQFVQYDWPGNVRELANLMERAVILCEGDTIQTSHLAVNGGTSPTTSNPETLPTLEEAERQLILRALKRTGWVLGGTSGAAEMLGINRSTLWSRMKKLGIEMPARRAQAE